MNDDKNTGKGMGVFHRPPARLCSMRGGRYYFVDSENRECWSDNTRILLYDKEHVQAVLAHHGYVLKDDGATIIPATQDTPSAPVPETEAFVARRTMPTNIERFLKDEAPVGVRRSGKKPSLAERRGKR
jgi:hypothetical protein